MKRRGRLPRKVIRRVYLEDSFREYVTWHSEWLRGLVARYKERGQFPVYPTQIIEYYKEPQDKDVAIFSVLCMKWDNGKELRQIASMRRLMGDSPWEWFRRREFVIISTGLRQDNAIDGYRNGRYWKVAKMFDILWDTCRRMGVVERPSEVFAKGGVAEFCQRVGEVCNIRDIAVKGQMAELVMRTHDGLGRGLWKNNGTVCPQFEDAVSLLQEWFPLWSTGMWSWDEATALLGLDSPHDFFYAWLAYRELQQRNPAECRRYGTIYHYRFNRGEMYARYRWIGPQGIVPSINI